MVGHKILANNRRTKEARRHQSPGKAIKHFLGKMSSRAADSASCAWALGAWKKGNCNCLRAHPGRFLGEMMLIWKGNIDMTGSNSVLIIHFIV